MPRQKIDAVKTASSIHKGDFSSLHGKSFLICDNIKKKGRDDTVNKPERKKTKITLVTLSERIDRLTEIVESGFKQVNTRLDYIVSANNLKDLPKSHK